MYNTAFGSQDAFNTQVPPIPFFAQENGRKRLSNGSLPDARVDNQKTLRVTNPDEFTFANESTLHEGDHSYSDDESMEKFR
jgi:cell wall integrity and stress response component